MSLSASTLPSETNTQWLASLELGFAMRSGACRMIRCRHQGPLYVQRPFYPEGHDLAHVYLLHPPGGMVSGDDLQVRVKVGDEAAVLMTTPGAGRAYRARPGKQWQKQLSLIEVGANASMEWLPQETIVYPQARANIQTKIDLSETGRFIGWEITCLGLSAGDRPFSAGEIKQRFEVTRCGHPLMIESLDLGDASRAIHAATAGLQSQTVTGLMVFDVLGLEDQVSCVLQELREIAALIGGPALAGLSCFNGLLVVRYLGPCSEQAKAFFHRLWSVLRPLLFSRPAVSPGIWST